MITGGTRGIGAGLVREFLKKGWNVTYTGTSKKSIEKSFGPLAGISGKVSYVAIKCDVRESADLQKVWEETVKTFGGVDIWVNNAGTTFERTPFNEIPAEEFKRVINTNLTGLMMATQLVYNHMKKQGYGAIYNMEGLGSDGRMVPGLIPYGTTKRAVRYFTVAFSKEAGGGSVILGSISPGMVLTDMLLDPLRRTPEKNRQTARIYNILADEPETVTPWLADKMIENKQNGVKIAWLTKGKVMKRFLFAPFLKRDIVSKYL